MEYKLLDYRLWIRADKTQQYSHYVKSANSFTITQELKRGDLVSMNDFTIRIDSVENPCFKHNPMVRWVLATII